MKHVWVATILLVLAASVSSQTTAFTYQGKLTDGGAPANGLYDFEFRLFAGPMGGNPIGPVETRHDVQVTNGVFTVQLDFGHTPFTSATNPAHYLEIAVRPGASTGGFQQLLPRNPITSSPYAVQSIKATQADIAGDAQKLGGVDASQFVQTNDPRLSDPRNPLPGSSGYIQNQSASPQSSSSFNISGTGRANLFDSVTHYNIGGARILSSPGSFNVFIGNGTGDPNNPGGNNVALGSFAGSNINGGSSNIAIGFNASFSGNNPQFQTVIGSGAVARSDNSITLGTASQSLQVPGSIFADNNVFVAGKLQVGSGITHERLTVNTATANYGLEHTDGAIKVGTWVGLGYGWYGTKSAHPLAFFTGGSGQQMTITTAGNVGIGTTVPAHRLSVNGEASKPGGGSWAVFSDKRLKTITGRFGRGLSAVLRLRPVQYHYRAGNPLGLRSDADYIGFSAQEVGRIIPEAVRSDDNGYLTVNNDPILWAMLNAIKEQHSQIDRLQKQIDALSKRQRVARKRTTNSWRKRS